MNTTSKTITLIVIIAVIALVIISSYVAGTPKGPIADVTYYCNGGKTIDARFFKGETKPPAGQGMPPTPGGTVALALSDGRAMTLPQTISADGGRYASADESFVFWNKGNGALVLENNEPKSYIGCIAAAPAPARGELPRVYANGTDGFSIRLPEGFTADESYRYQAMGPGKDIAGTKFTVLASAAMGTNLSTDTYLSVEEIPQIQNCGANLFLEQGAARTVTDGDTTYSVASSTGAAAGNRYEETVYALPGTNPCIAVRYFIHYGVFENYPAGAVREFDAQALHEQFDAIRRTLVVK